MAAVVLSLLIDLAILGVWCYIASYLYRLEKMRCECAQGWRHDFLKYYLLVIIVLAVLKFAGISTLTWPAPIVAVIAVSSVAFIVIAYQYVHALKTCKCSEDTARTVLEIVNYIQIATLAFMVLFTLGLAIFLAGASKSSSRRR